MGNVGRVFCVALPFILTAASLVSLLIVGLTGIANNNLFMFRVNTTDLSIDRANLQNLLKISTRDLAARDTIPTDLKWHDVRFLDELKDVGGNKANSGGTSEGIKTDNITAADLGLGQYYDVNLWGFCVQPQQGDRTCTKAEFDWAQKALNTSAITGLGASAGVNITLPTEINSSLDAFKAVSKWTQVVFIIATVALAIELLLGLFTSCSRVVSCFTYIVSGLATAAVIGAATMITVTSALVVGAVEASAKFYGVRASFNTSFLAVAWLAAAFAIAASFFWLFTICCCKPEHRSSSKHRSHGPESEKFIPSGGSGYAPLHDDNSRFSQQSYGAPRHQPHVGPRSNAAYEPYSHSNV